MSLNLWSPSETVSLADLQVLTSKTLRTTSVKLGSKPVGTSERTCEPAANAKIILIQVDDIFTGI